MKKDSFEVAREAMVLGQLRHRGIEDERVLAAFLKVPRELFVPQDLKQYAYQDWPLSLGYGQTISQPYIVALMTQMLGVNPGDAVLEVGTGSGYQAAILFALGAKVYGVERIADLAKKAVKRLALLGYNLEVKIGDGSQGWDHFSLYDRIVVTAASFSVPEPLLSQVKIGGKILAPIGTRQSQELTLVERVGPDNYKYSKGCACIFVPLIGEYAWGE